MLIKMESNGGESKIDDRFTTTLKDFQTYNLALNTWVDTNISASKAKALVMYLSTAHEYAGVWILDNGTIKAISRRPVIDVKIENGTIWIEQVLSASVLAFNVAIWGDN